MTTSLLLSAFSSAVTICKGGDDMLSEQNLSIIIWISNHCILQTNQLRCTL